MKYAINLCSFGEYADPRTVARLAQYVEAAGWDALFYWDHVAFAWGMPSGDAFVALAGAATLTNRILLGTAVTPLPRRRPHIVAHQLATLDVLSGGRVIFGAGLGGRPREFEAFGETADARERAAMLDEGLEIVRRLLDGEEVSSEGRYRMNAVRLAPLPLQQHLPIWIGGNSRPALRRAARYDGWMADTSNQKEMTMSPEEVEAAIVGIHRANVETDMASVETHMASVETHMPDVGFHNARPTRPFDVSVTGYTQPGETAIVREYEAAGATWWQEAIHGTRGTEEEMLRRVLAGPPE